MSVGVPSTPSGRPVPSMWHRRRAAVLRGDGLVKEFGGLVAVNDVSIEIPEHSIVSIIGPNGAGKTTLFNMLTGLYKPTRGRMWFDGRDITRKRPDRITSLGVARTFQNIRLFGAMSALENVMVGRHARMKAGLLGSIARTPGVRREERAVRERAAEAAALRRASATAVRAGGHQPLATEISAAWRSHARWPPIQSCCSSTSRRQA